ncbi:HYR domain-containing protein [Candidatus Halocynthiibacter alkanivorans]|uniref:HYR domain-containing protein n=1 Tax=Candidatus Halocynthiibacter alkanivorans TaxID=2267619 RepID=UPI000DF20262|nr:HYR domain-containing protein [Candidatus Halocynthiibacter alkanivorans]
MFGNLARTLSNSAKHLTFGALASLSLSGPGHAITATSASTSGATGNTANCIGTTVTFAFDVTGTQTDAAPAGNPNIDRFVFRMVDALDNIISSGGFTVANGSTLNTSVSMKVGADPNFPATSDTLVAPVQRPFRLQIFESNTTGVGTSPTVPAGAALVTSAPFDPAGGGNYTADCSSLSGGSSPADSTDPIVSVPSNINVGTDAGQSTAVVTYSVTASDNVGVTSGPTRTAGLASGASFPIGTTTVTHTAADAASNTGSGSFTVTVSDDEKPSISVPSNITVATDAGQTTAVVSYTVTATDNVSVTSGPARTAGLASGSAFPVGTTTVTHTASDAVGNLQTESFTVTVNDGENPVVNVPANISVSTDAGQSTAVVTYAVTASDNVGVTSGPTLSTGLVSGAAFSVGTTTVTHTAADAAGNTGSGSFTVTVSDNEKPVVSVPANIAVDTDSGLPTAVVSFAVSATDAVDGPLTPVVTSSPTSGLNSGSAFPIGTTTISVSATDVATNSASETFTVTVSDNQAPVFTSSQPDIDVEIDFDLTSAVVTFPTPAATDNSGAVTVTQITGPVSGSAFSVGSTLVEFEARDAAGLTSVLQFYVNVALIPPGTVTFVVNSDDDGTISFTSATTALNTAVNVSGGTGSSASLNVVPGSYTVNYTLPSGFAVTAASCSSPSGTVDIGTRQLSLSFTRGQSYTCTLAALNSAEQTGEQIQHFLDNRARQIVANLPGQGRRIARLRGERNATVVSMNGHTLLTGVSPVGVQVSEQDVRLSFSSKSSSHDASSAYSDWDIWGEAYFSRYETSTGEGDFAILHAGADYMINSNAILGFGLQIDKVKEDTLGSTATTEGAGWMFGPYYTARLEDNLYIDAALKYGQAENEISPLGTYTDEFGSERWLVRVGLFGNVDRGQMTIQPGISLNYFEETSDSYVDGLGVTIASQQSSVGDFEAGAKFTWTDPAGHGSQYVSLEGIWTFEASGQGVSQSTVDNGFRARLGLGGTLVSENGGAFDFGMSYDGIGDGGYEAVSVSLGYSMAF